MKPFLNWLAAAASLAGLFFSISPPVSTLGPWKILFLLVIAVTFGGAALHDIYDDFKRSAKKYRNTAAINKYMFKMLKNSGVCEICSRDASWVSEERIYELLKSKAKSGELRFLVHLKTNELAVLERLGAEVIEYGRLGFDPMTRFTIVNSGNSASSYVAIGRRRPNEPHIIEEFDASHPTHSMAVDLIRSVKIANDFSQKA